MEDLEGFYKSLLRFGRFIEEIQDLSFTGIGDKLNRTEKKLLTVVCAAQMDRRRIISTQIAEMLNITRSAVSQMVDKLVKDGYLQRRAALSDKKIAYIELTDEFWCQYSDGIRRSVESLNRIIRKVGRDNIEKMLTIAEEFMMFANMEKKPEKKSRTK